MFGELITGVCPRGPIEPRGGFRPDGGYWIAGRRNESDPRRERKKKMLYADLLFQLPFFFYSSSCSAQKKVNTVTCSIISRGGGHRFYFTFPGERISLNQWTCFLYLHEYTWKIRGSFVVEWSRVSHSSSKEKDDGDCLCCARRIHPTSTMSNSLSRKWCNIFLSTAVR